MNKKLLAVIPIFDNLDRTLELIEFIKHNDLGDHLLVLDTVHSEQNKKINQKLKETHKTFNYQCLSINSHLRGCLFKKSIYFSQENGFEHLIFFNEGWVDHQSDITTIISNKNFLEKPLITSNRQPKSMNPGRFYDWISNFLTSIVINKKIEDTKGDGFFIVEVKNFVTNNFDHIYKIHENDFFFLDLLLLLANANLSFEFARPTQLNTPGSKVNLNTKRFIKICYFALYNLFLKKRYLKKNFSKLSPTLLLQNNYIEDKDKAILLKNEKIKKLDQYIKHPHQNYHNEDAYKLPFVHPDKVEKKAEVLRLDHENSRNKDVIVVNWCLTNICNFKCTYCPEELHNGTNRGVSLQSVKNFFYKIKMRHPEKMIFFEFTGGEVTYYKNFYDLIKFLKENGCYVGIISNGSRKLNFWEKHHPYLDHICLSYHSEQGKPDHFFDVAAYLTDKMTTHVNIMMKPENFDTCHHLAQKIADSCEVSIAMQPLLEGMDGDLYDYTPEQKEILDKQKLIWSDNPKYKRASDHDETVFRGAMRATLSNKTTTIFSTPELISNHLNRWAGWKCYAGVENIVVDMKGNIQRGWCGVGGVIGNVSDDDLSLPKKPIVCDKLQCSCGLDIMCTKIKIN